ncbi:carboxypeptidase-like protein [Aquimarina brevivitae]|uniref:Carboxypeptidase-like protein n=2 Tax=Aquimarina brevivitae TaxID=323412 RepID=A0A4Q7PFU7_9FLAO|nr:carboxypeptidase-like protein [Aquimarina brevivitae]
MKMSQLKRGLCFIFFISFCVIGYAQETGFKGKVVDATTNEEIPDVTVAIEKSILSATTNAEGVFQFIGVQLPLGEQIAVISKPGYITKRYPVVINEGQVLDLQTVDLEYDLNQEQIQIGTISLSDNELDDDEDTSFNVSGLLQASRDVFLNAAAFDFSAAFFRPRGLGNENGKVLINGIEMNKLFNGRPQWSNWGGLNDVQRNQEFSMGISANDYTFGDLSGTTNIVMRASQYRKGGRVSYAASNRSYLGRVMGTYNSGLMADGWAYSISLSRRFGDEGYIDGTLYDANSIFASVEKKFNDQHSLNFTSFYTPNRRGRSTAITQEVFELKGNRYNPNWGYYDGEKKNSRVREIEEPVLMLNHYWDINDKFSLNTNLAYQTGKIGNSRLDNNGSDLVLSSDGQETYQGGGASRDTNPIHPSYLPSSFLDMPNPTPLDYQNAYLAQEAFRADGQLNWGRLIAANQLNTAQGRNATYIFYEDRTDDTQWTVNSIFRGQLTSAISVNGAINYRKLKSENFAEVIDLLGGTGFLDVDTFGSQLDNDVEPEFRLTPAELADRAQSDLRNRNRIVREGDRYDYNYEIDSDVVNGFAQAEFKTRLIDFYLGGNVTQTSYQRNGLFENGYFPGEGRTGSFGRSDKLEFTNYGGKGGFTFKIDGRNLIDFNGAYYTKAPTIRSSFANARQNNRTVSQLIAAEPTLNGELESEKIQSADLSYILRTPKIKARLTGYYTKIEDATDIAFFFTQAISGSDAGFVQEILTDIDKRHIGAELGIEYQITPTIKLKGAAAIGQYTYDNNPDLFVTSTSPSFLGQNLGTGENTIEGARYFGKSQLKDYKLANGPQNVAQLGFEYRDPDFWWFGATANYFSNAYIDVSPFARTQNFYLDNDGLPFNDYDQNVARELLRQEKFNSYYLVNVVGGKSWKFGDYYVGFFASINNVLDERYITGGFEQSRSANYRASLEEAQRDTPVFGPRYFFGFGSSYYLNLYLRF